jgi:hypothetical protein
LTFLLHSHGRDNSLRIWQIRAEDESTLSTALPSEEPSGDRPMPWLLHTLPVNTLNFCAFSMCYAHAGGRLGGCENPDVTTKTNLNEETASILVAVPARDDKMAEVYQFPEERLRFVVPRAQTKDTGKCLISVQQ